MDVTHVSQPAALQSVLLSIEETQRALSLSRSMVYKLIADGQLETVHIGRANRILASSVVAYTERLRQAQR